MEIKGYRNNLLLEALVSVLLLHLQVVKPFGVTYIRERTGDIKSYFYPRCYPKHYHQTWNIIAPIGYRIRLQFKDFDLGPCNDGHRFTVIRSKFVRQSWSDRFTGVTRKSGNLYLCGQRLPPMIESLGSEMLFYFPYQPWRTKGCRFWAHYEMFNENELKPTSLLKPTQSYRINTTLQPSGSVTYLRTITGVIKSHFYPQNYPKDYTQQWRIKSPRGFLIRLKFQVFNVTNCTPSGDHLDVWYGRGMFMSLCGQQLPPTVESLDSEIELYFHSHPDSQGGRFWAYYEMFKENKPKTIYPTLQITRLGFDIDTGDPESNGSDMGFSTQTLLYLMMGCFTFLFIVTIACVSKRRHRQQSQSPTSTNVLNNTDPENEFWSLELNYGDVPPSYEEVLRQSIPDISSMTQQPLGESTATENEGIDSSGLPSYREALRLSNNHRL